MMGKIVYQQRVTSPVDGVNATTIDVSNLANGVYFLQLQNPDSDIRTIRLVVEKDK
jgi:hypothetical protein